jgi:hypothetical protein
MLAHRRRALVIATRREGVQERGRSFTDVLEMVCRTRRRRDAREHARCLHHLHRILNVSFKTASSMMRRLGEN